jgi:hypothetical protein
MEELGPLTPRPAASAQEQWALYQTGFISHQEIESFVAERFHEGHIDALEELLALMDARLAEIPDDDESDNAEELSKLIAYTVMSIQGAHDAIDHEMGIVLDQLQKLDSRPEDE